MKIPHQTPAKDPPEEILEPQKVPDESRFPIESPEQTDLREDIPEQSTLREDIPQESKQIETTPDPSPQKEEMPSDLNEENCVTVGGQKIEIKPTKLKYFRNKAASAYGIIKAVPLHEFLTYEKGILDPKRDADQLLYDFLVAVFDDSAFVRDHYDDLDADTVDRICKIFGRINHVDEKEEAARKNKEAQAQAKH